VPDAVARTDLEGNVTFCTQRHATLFGYNNAEELIGTNAFSVIVPEEEGKARAGMERALNGEVIRNDHHCRCVDGSVVLVELSANLVRSASGEPEGFIAVLRDVSVEREREAQIRQLVREKTRLIAELKHRTKNHLSTVAGFISLQMSEEQNQDTRRALQETQNRITLIRELYEQIYDLPETEDEIEIRPYLLRVVAQLRDSFAGILDVSIDTRVCESRVRSNILLHIGIIANELMTNSLKYAFSSSDDPGSIQLDVSEPTEETIRIEVRDNGSGFPETILEGRDFGFGLQVVEAYAQESGGTVSLHNHADGAVAAVVLLKE
jgi:PAS domain S-box-containing protein